jgi:hypothetical protein
MNPDYEKLGEIAKQIVIQTMIEGEKEHGADGWNDEAILSHVNHARHHTDDRYTEMMTEEKHNNEDHIAHALTRCAMIKYLEQK